MNLDEYPHLRELRAARATLGRVHVTAPGEALPLMGTRPGSEPEEHRPELSETPARPGLLQRIRNAIAALRA